jgi:hypothetical protein
MKVVIADRQLIFHVLNACFVNLQISPRIAELGVLKGDNAAAMDQILRPSALFLVDAWSAAEMKKYIERSKGKEWVTVSQSPLVEGYYGGSVLEDATFDRLFKVASERFGGKPHVKIIRSNTREGFDRLREAGGGRALDMIYVDANHEYEEVFLELMTYQKLLGPDGVIQLNDCCHSLEGLAQNFGVLEAVVKFCKFTDFYPAVLTNTDWSDVLLLRRGSRLVPVIDQVFATNDITYIGVPEQLLGAVRVNSGARKNLSFV